MIACRLARVPCAVGRHKARGDSGLVTEYASQGGTRLLRDRRRRDRCGRDLPQDYARERPERDLRQRPCRASPPMLGTDEADALSRRGRWANCASAEARAPSAATAGCIASVAPASAPATSPCPAGTSEASLGTASTSLSAAHAGPTSLRLVTHATAPRAAPCVKSSAPSDGCGRVDRAGDGTVTKMGNFTTTCPKCATEFPVDALD